MNHNFKVLRSEPSEIVFNIVDPRFWICRKFRSKSVYYYSKLQSFLLTCNTKYVEKWRIELTGIHRVINFWCDGWTYMFVRLSWRFTNLTPNGDQLSERNEIAGFITILPSVHTVHSVFIILPSDMGINIYGHMFKLWIFMFTWMYVRL